MEIDCGDGNQIMKCMRQYVLIRGGNNTKKGFKELHRLVDEAEAEENDVETPAERQAYTDYEREAFGGV